MKYIKDIKDEKEIIQNVKRVASCTWVVRL